MGQPFCCYLGVYPSSVFIFFETRQSLQMQLRAIHGPGAPIIIHHFCLLSAKKMHFQALITALLLIPLVENSLSQNQCIQALITALLSLSFYY
jgi:hypothetical protein